MDLPLLQYPLDPTGKNPDNLVHGEIHNLPNRNIRAIAPTYGAFFTEDLKVVDNVTQVELIKGTQYVTVDLVQTATEVYGKEICSVILIIDKNVNSSVLITYQALGGMYGGGSTIGAGKTAGNSAASAAASGSDAWMSDTSALTAAINGTGSSAYQPVSSASTIRVF